MPLVTVATSGEHTVAAARDGQVHAMSRRGLMPLRTHSSIASCSPILCFLAQRPAHCLHPYPPIRTQVYAWGRADTGALGLGDPSAIAAASQKGENEIVVTTPQPIPGLFVLVSQ